MDRRITAAALIALAGCAGGGLTRVFQGTPRGLNYAQYRSLAAGMEAAAIRSAFGAPADLLERDGVIRGLAYPCEDEGGRLLELRMVFDGEGRLQEWALRSPGAAGPEPAGG